MAEASSSRTDDEVNLLDIPWFHPKLTRHQAEAELANCDEGIYLLRPRVQSDSHASNFSLDVKCAHSVKHFKVNVLRNQIEFGQEVFATMISFLSHFENCPLIGDDTGDLCILKYPYPRDVDEIHDYQLVTEHFLSQNDKPDPKGCNGPVYSLVSKEGYLVKRGAIVKTWKRRWFVLKGSELNYYHKENDERPIRSINIQMCLEVAACQMIAEKNNIFRIVLPRRTFYLQAPNVDVMTDWITLLQWKMRELKESENQRT